MLTKLARNRRSDQEVCQALEAAGWKIITEWACETGDIESLRNLFKRFLPRTDTQGTRRQFGR